MNTNGLLNELKKEINSTDFHSMILAMIIYTLG